MKRQILLVEDDSALQELLRQVLEREGYDVTLATGGKMAIAKLESQTISMVILDFHLPEMSGDVLIKEVRRLVSSEVPIILMTGELEVDASNLPHGVEVLLKPFRGADLLNRVRELLNPR